MNSKFMSICNLIVITFAVYFEGHGQVTPDKDRVVLPSVQDWNFTKYGNTPVNLNTGALSLNIPLYSYKDQDFDFTISAGYASTGYMPNIHANSLGLGWILNAGGCVTREIRGAADDARKLTYNEENYGYLYYSNSQNNYSIISAFQNYHNHFNPFLYRAYNENNIPICYDTQPDIFHFNFGTHKGSFVLGPNGEKNVYNTTHPNGEYKIDLICDDKDFSESTLLTIVITTGDGYQYTFGRDTCLKEHSTYLLGNDPYYGYSINHKLSWPITSIKVPNGRQIIFSYIHAEITETYKPEIKGYAGLEKQQNLFPDYYYYHYSVVGEYNSPVKRWKKDSQLKEIDIDNKIRIDFHYSERRRELFLNEDNPGHIEQGSLQTPGKLDRITVTQLAFTDDPIILKDCRFFYRYAPNPLGNPVLFLEKLYLTGEGEYKMNYHNIEASFPKHGSSGLDMWGYYNNQNRYIYSFMGNKDQKPNLEGTMLGIIRKLSYPTGGYSEFDYEMNDCAHIIARKRIEPRHSFLTSCDRMTVGGIRIRRITDHLENGTIASKRDFSYMTDGRSSGIALNFPIYIEPNQSGSTRSGLEPVPQYHMEGPNSMNYTMDKSHIEYSQVSEIYADGSRTDYHFSNYRSIPDTTLNIAPISFYAWKPVSSFFQQKSVSRHTQRGKLIRKSIYDNEGTKLSEERNHYLRTPLKYIDGVEFTETALYIHRTYVSDYPLVMSERISYAGGDSLCESCSFEYNFRGQNTQRKKVYADGKVITETIRYLLTEDDYPYASLQGYMLRKNLLNYPLETKSYMSTSDAYTDILTSKNKIEYSIFRAQVYPFKLITYDITPGSKDSMEWVFEDYDHCGNLIEMTSPTGLSTTYIWGYDGLYLLAKIDNVTRDEINNIDGFRRFQYEIFPKNLSSQLKQNLKNYSKGLCHFYSHKPFAGVTWVESPDGNYTSYEYDEYGRIKRIRDRESKMLKEYEYFIKNQ